MAYLRQCLQELRESHLRAGADNPLQQGDLPARMTPSASRRVDAVHRQGFMERKCDEGTRRGQASG